MADPEVLVASDDGVMVITLNRPSARNAVNRALAEQVAAALDELDSRADLRLGILTGAGGTFCAGMDLKAFVLGENPMVPGRGFAGIVERPAAKP
nr:enoyl-CoA hydratase-related protein [Micromonospora sp. DSM 115978]